VALPFFGVVTEIFPVFSRRPVFGYKGLVLATLAIGALSTSVWAHHMFVTGDILLPFFAATSLLIAVPTGVKVFNWIGTMWEGSLSFEAPMKFSIGFLVTFVGGGVTGVMLASPTLDFHLSDSYFVVAHFHYVMGGTVIFALFAAIYFWWPKVTGRLLSERLGSIHFWLLMIGFNVTFFVQHLLGRDGMPRRVADYRPIDDFELWNKISSFGYLILVASMVPFLIAVVRSLRSPPTVGADPWHANSLEWATMSPPVEHNFTWLPPIRSERPVFDLRWINHEGVGAPHSVEAWQARQEHDAQWLPLHQWSTADEESLTTGPRPVERTGDGQERAPESVESDGEGGS
jgi:cytochrome c oxidase subunit 1